MDNGEQQPIDPRETLGSKNLAERVSKCSYPTLRVRLDGGYEDGKKGDGVRRGKKVLSGARKLRKVDDPMVDGLMADIASRSPDSEDKSAEYVSSRFVFLGEDGKRYYMNQQRMAPDNALLKKFYEDNPILEVVHLVPVVDRQYKEETYKETVPNGKALGGLGWQRSKVVEKTRKTFIGGQNVPFNKLVKGGGLPPTDENAYLLHYSCNPNVLNDIDLFSGRTGVNPRGLGSSDHYLLSLIMPEGIAREVDAKLRVDPKYIREIYKQVINDEYPGAADGNQALPPFERIDQKGLKMYLALDTDVALGPDMDRFHTFDPKNVVDPASLQQEDGSVMIPQVLQRYTGFSKISPNK